MPQASRRARPSPSLSSCTGQRGSLGAPAGGRSPWKTGPLALLARRGGTHGPQTGRERLQATHAGQFQPSRMTDRLSRTGHCATTRDAIPDPVGDGLALLGPQHRPLPSPGPWKGLRAQLAACYGVSRASKHDTGIPAQGSSALRPPGQELWQPLPFESFIPTPASQFLPSLVVCSCPSSGKQ